MLSLALQLNSVFLDRFLFFKVCLHLRLLDYVLALQVDIGTL